MIRFTLFPGFTRFTGFTTFAGFWNPVNPVNLVQVRRQPRRTEQAHELGPSSRWIAVGSAAALDVVLDQIFSQVVVDDVASIFVEEVCPLLGASRRQHRKPG